MGKDLDLAESFDEYIDDLRSICGRPTASLRSELAHAFIRRNRKRILALRRTWVDPDACSDLDIAREIENLLAISRCYGFRVPAGGEGDALANLAFFVGWTAATCAFEVDKFEE